MFYMFYCEDSLKTSKLFCGDISAKYLAIKILPFSREVTDFKHDFPMHLYRVHFHILGCNLLNIAWDSYSKFCFQERAEENLIERGCEESVRLQFAPVSGLPNPE